MADKKETIHVKDCNARMCVSPCMRACVCVLGESVRDEFALSCWRDSRPLICIHAILVRAPKVYREELGNVRVIDISLCLNCVGVS